MVPDIEAIGDAASGGLLARAVERDAGEATGHTRESACLNCGCKLTGAYCHCCGQQAHVHRTISAWWHDFLHGVLHVDGKFWRTLPMLALHPGELTRRYARGERAKFVSPLALFLFSVFAMFAAFSLLGAPTRFEGATTPGQDRAEAEREIRAERAEAEEEIAALQAQLQNAKAAGKPTSGIEAEIVGERRQLAVQEQAYRLAIRLANEEEQREAAQPGAKPSAGAPSASADSAATEAGSEPKITVLSKTGWEPLDKAVAKAEANPALLFYKLQSNAYKFSWALIPISLPFVWMLFLHRRRYRRDYGAYDHLIFVTYSISFMSIGAIILALLRPVGVGEAIIGTAITFVPRIHIYRQLRGAYQLSRWSAAWRTFVLLVNSFIALGLFFVLLVLAGVLG